MEPGGLENNPDTKNQPPVEPGGVSQTRKVSTLGDYGFTNSKPKGATGQHFVGKKMKRKGDALGANRVQMSIESFQFKKIDTMPKLPTLEGSRSKISDRLGTKLMRAKQEKASLAKKPNCNLQSKQLQGVRKRSKKGKINSSKARINLTRMTSDGLKIGPKPL